MPGLRGVLHDPLLSVVMPVYNERDTIEEIVGRDVQAFPASIRGGCRDVHNAIYETCISYPVDHAVSA